MSQEKVAERLLSHLIIYFIIFFMPLGSFTSRFNSATPALLHISPSR